MLDEKYIFSNPQWGGCGGGHFPPEKPRYTMTEEVENTAREMRNTIDRLLRFEERLKMEIDSLMSKLTSDNVLFKNTFADSHRTFLEAVKNEVNTFEANVDASITLFKNDIETNYSQLSEDVYKTVNDKYIEFVNKLNTYKTELNDTYDALQKHVDTLVAQSESNMNTLYANFTATINRKISDMQKTISDAVYYMKANIVETVVAEVMRMKDSGELEDAIADSLKIHTVEYYGAVGDGLADDTEAIQRAINTTAELKIPLYFKNTYLVKPLTLPSNARLELGNAVLKLDETDGNIFTGANVEKITINGGTIDCQKSINHSTNLSGGGIYISHGNNIKIDTKMINCAREGFYITDSNKVDIKLDYSEGGFNGSSYYGYGGTLLQCTDCKVHDSKFYDIDGYGIHIQKCAHISVRNNRFDNIVHGTNGIGITITNSDNVIVAENDITGCEGRGVECNHSRKVKFIANFIDNCGSGYTFGDNGTSLYNEDIEISTDTQTRIANYSYSVNFVKGMRVSNSKSNKCLTTTFNINSEDIEFNNVKFECNHSAIIFYPRFTLNNVTFTDWHFVHSSPTKLSLRMEPVILAIGETKTITIPCGDSYEGVNTIIGGFSNPVNYSQRKMITSPCLLSAGLILFKDTESGGGEIYHKGYDIPVRFERVDSSRQILIGNSSTVDLKATIEIV